MKVCFRKSLVAASVAAAFGGFSANSVAAIHGDAGEANLVPFAVWSDDISATQVGGSAVDTVVKLTIPSTVGGKTIPNSFTANNTTPNNAATPPGTPAISIDETPFAIFLADASLPATQLAWRLHWYFMSYRSVELANGPIRITPEDSYNVSLRELLNGSFEDVPGYLLFTTNAGSTGNRANFAFFADAYLTVDNRNFFGDDGSYDSQYAFEIPVLPMSDGADVPATISATNQVVEVGTNTGGPVASPLFSGLTTAWNGATLAGAKKVIDLAVADRTVYNPEVVETLTAAAAQVPNDAVVNVPPGFGASTLMLVWNDRNFEGWDGGLVGFDLFNNEENGCSGSISLPNQLNLVWFPGFSGPNGVIFPPVDWHVDPGNANAPYFLDTLPVFPSPTQSSYFLTPSQCSGPDSFIRFQLPLVSNTAPGSAMFAFSLQAWWDGAFLYPRGNLPITPIGQLVTDKAGFPSTEAHDRGLFQSSANAFR